MAPHDVWSRIGLRRRILDGRGFGFFSGCYGREIGFVLRIRALVVVLHVIPVLPGGSSTDGLSIKRYATGSQGREERSTRETRDFSQKSPGTSRFSGSLEQFPTRKHYT